MALNENIISYIEHEYHHCCRPFFTQQQFHADLVTLRNDVLEGKILERYTGICNNVTRIRWKESDMNRHKYYLAVAYFARHWPHHSGSLSFPVPSVYDSKDYSKDLWVGKDGDMRMKLLDYLISETA